MKANPFRGEVEIQAEGGPYIFRLGMAEYAILEKAFNVRSIQEIFVRFAKSAEAFSACDTMMILKTGFHRYHPELSDDALSDIIAEVGIEKLMDAMTQSSAHMAKVKGGDSPNVKSEEEASATS